MNTAIRLALGAAIASALVAVPASAGGGWGYPGYRPPPPRYGGYYGGYYGGGNGGAIAAAAIGGLLFGGLIGAAAAQPKAPAYTVATVTPGVVPAPVYPAYPAPQPYPAPQAYPAPAPYPAVPPGVVAGASAASAQAEMCSRAAERFAQGSGGFARATSVSTVTGDQANAQVTGTLEIANAPAGAPSVVGFTCWASYGTVTGIKLG